MNQIEHDPNEPKIDRSMKIYWIAGGLLSLAWLHQLVFEVPDWGQLLLGIGTGCVLAAWAIEISGDKVPESWRRKN
ncbi:hypothetical protein [Brucella intermedia]|uniref:hypothetical protein n=1 Tax=Brucella intermedia TaxID=94625 RepID=UPI002362064A|nr:hypothetical protein [Brucella intermedia]